MKYFFPLFLVVLLAGALIVPVHADQPSRSDASLRGLEGLLNRLTETAERTYGSVTVGGVDANANFLESTIGRLISYALSMAGIVLVGFLTYGGFVWLNARGRDEEVDRAKDIITNSIIGIGIVLAAFAIVYVASFLLSRATLHDNPYRASGF